MCVIIVRQPGITIPFEKIKAACTVNNDGWGLAVADRGRVEVIRKVDTTNDPEIVYKALEDTKDLRVMLHLRYVTVGERNLANCHPFEVLNHKDHGEDIILAHNGTISQFRKPDDGNSDTKHFVDYYVRPLLLRAKAFQPHKPVLEDEFALELLKYTVGSSSLVTFFTPTNDLTVNKSHGKDFVGWWASNTYSFDIRHREPTTYWHNRPPSPWKNDHWKDGQAYGSSTVVPYVHKPKKTTHQSTLDFTEVPVTVTEHKTIIEKESTEIKKALSMAANTPSPLLIQNMLNQKRWSFCKISGIDSLKELCRFDPTDLKELVALYPISAAALLEDLLFELYLKDHKPLEHTVVQANTPELASVTVQ